MNKDLEKIRNHSREILGDYPEKKAALVKDLREAEAYLNSAKATLDAAEDLESYDNAAEEVKRAEMAVKFSRNAIDKLDAAPRMGEADYMGAITTCKSIMDKATSAYREKAAALMDQLKTLTDDYRQIAEDTNYTLIMLDEAANVLQSKYPYKIYKRQGEPDQKVLNKSAWQDYALRYEPSTACRMATSCTEAARATHPTHMHDSLLIAAWRAVGQAYPRKSF